MTTTRETKPKRGRAQKAATSSGKNRAIAYVRVSDVGDRGGESFISTKVQRETIAAKAEALGLDVVDLFEDLNQSGGKYDRPGFQRALERIEAGEADVLVVAKLTRFARSVLDTHRAIERLEAAGARLVACDMDVDTSTATGRLIRGVLATLAEFELELAAEQWRTAKANAIDRGVKIATRAPFGYRFDDDHRLEPVEADAAVVRELFELRSSGASYGDLLRHFEASTGRRGFRQTMSRILRNRAYLGAVSYDDLVNDDAHPPIVDLELFEAVQAVNDDRAGLEGGGGHAGPVKSLLAGIARCEGCGRGLVRNSRGGKRSSVYRCPSEASHCPAKASIGEAVLDEYVVEQLFAWAGPAADEVVELDVGEPGGARAEAERRLAEAEAALVRWAENVEAELEDPAAYRAGMTARVQLRDARRAELDALGEASEVEVIRATLRSAWPVLEVDERRRLLRVVLSAVVVRKTPRPKAPVAERADLLLKVGGAMGEPVGDDAAQLDE